MCYVLLFPVRDITCQKSYMLWVTCDNVISILATFDIIFEYFGIISLKASNIRESYNLILDEDKAIFEGLLD